MFCNPNPMSFARLSTGSNSLSEFLRAVQGNASTKTRAEVRGGGRKPYAQKGTGNARQGSRRSPLLPGGGVVFGPKVRVTRPVFLWVRRTASGQFKGLTSRYIQRASFHQTRKNADHCKRGTLDVLLRAGRMTKALKQNALCRNQELERKS